jgi:hypothetical protein
MMSPKLGPANLPPLPPRPPLFLEESRISTITIPIKIKIGNGEGCLFDFRLPLNFPFRTSKMASAPLSKPL